MMYVDGANEPLLEQQQQAAVADACVMCVASSDTPRLCCHTDGRTEKATFGNDWV